MAYDRNGLELTPICNSKNSYKFTTVVPASRKYAAYAQAVRFSGVFSMVTIGKFDDPRDAAYIGQMFSKQYDINQVYQMVIDKTFDQVAEQFIKDTEIPEWKYPAEGLDWDDILGVKGSTKNRVDSAREALIEALKNAGKPIPVLAKAKQMIAEVEKLYNQGMSFRGAAKHVVATI